MFKKYLPFSICCLLLSLIACDNSIKASRAPKIDLSTQQVVFSAPALGTNESKFALEVRNSGTADLIIVKAEILENPAPTNPQNLEFSIIDSDN